MLVTMDLEHLHLHLKGLRHLEAFGGCAYKSALYTPMLSFGKRFPEDATVASREHLQFWPSQLCPGAKLGWNPV